MRKQLTACSLQLTAKIKVFYSDFLPTANCQLGTGFTLIETLVAVSLLTIAVVAPMSLTSRSLATAYYAREQITAFHLAQEAIETVRHVRDHNILVTALETPTDILSGIPIGMPFIVNSLNDEIDATPCGGGTCPPLQRDPSDTFYGYGTGWTSTPYTRTVEVETVRSDAGVPQEIRVSVTVSWQASVLQIPRTITISENLYRWVKDDDT